MGTGDAATTTALPGRGKLASYQGNDFSAEAGIPFESCVRPKFKAAGIPAQLVVDSCYSIPLNDAKCEVFIVGIYFEGATRPRVHPRLYHGCVRRPDRCYAGSVGQTREPIHHRVAE
jgi:hypothetical protein